MLTTQYLRLALPNQINQRRDPYLDAVPPSGTGTHTVKIIVTEKCINTEMLIRWKVRTCLLSLEKFFRFFDLEKLTLNGHFSVQFWTK